MSERAKKGYKKLLSKNGKLVFNECEGVTW